ncbi:MAG: chemotaxis protein CheW [Ruminococcus sp.]|nr:chemotaxis protein CheW [Ruminococcus sp.]
MPVVDAAKRFGIGECKVSDYSCFIMARLDEQSGFEEKYDRCAVLVDEVSGSVKGADKLLPPPSLSEESFAEYLIGTFSDDGEIYYVISPEKLARLKG